MPQKLTQATINKLTRGFITEAGELTFPEEATVDELNCVLNRDGSRQRRKGLTALTGTDSLGFTYTNTDRTYNYFVWKNAGGASGLDLLVVQLGASLRFFDLNTQLLNEGLKPFNIALDDYLAPTKTVVEPCSFTMIFGGLVVSSASTDTIYVNYDLGTDTINVDTLVFRIRDFEWQSSYDQLDRSILVTDITDARLYDTYNAGWYGSSGGSTALASFIGTSTLGSSGGLGGLTGARPISSWPEGTTALFYPPLTHPWFSAKVDGGFSVSDWINIQASSSVAANGLFKLDFFNQDRATVSGIASLPIFTESNRFTTVATYAGRVWYAGLGSGKQSGKILFSQVVINASPENALASLGQCLQKNDPTSEYFSDILDTDGGVIEISEAVNIKKIHPYNNSLFVFAENGIWVIGGIDDRFSPAGYTVNKISTTGIDSTLSFVSAEGVPFWWSTTSINTISFDEGSGFPVVQNLSIETIQTYFDGIGNSARSKVFGDYDEFNKQIFWWYPEVGADSYRKDCALILDIPLKAFYPWKVAGTDTKYVVGSFYRGSNSNYVVQETLTDNVLAPITTATGDVFINVSVEGSVADTELVVIYFDTDLHFGNFTSRSYLDYSTEAYQTFFESGYFFAGDLLTKKTTPLITVYMRSTEDGFSGNETIGYSPINPSSLILKSFWDFKFLPSSTQQAYRVKPFITVDPTDLTNNQQKSSVVVTRLKVRGRGRSMRLRFEAEDGKDFIFLGYSVLVGINDRF